MTAQTITQFPRPSSARPLRYDLKWDGFRALARKNGRGVVELVSRRQKSLTRSFQEVAAVVAEHVPARTGLDGEIVRLSADGRLDFRALLERNGAGRCAGALAAAAPCHYVAFDLLELAGEDYRPRPLTERRAALEQLLAPVPAASSLTLCPQTGDPDEALEWFAAYAPVGIEGLVVKVASSPYRPRDRHAWMKYKRRVTTEVIVGGVVGGLDRPAELLVGRYGAGGEPLRVVGRSVPLSDRQAAELAPVLKPADGDHPWPAELPASWTGGRYGKSDPTRYVQVAPELVVEVAVDMATAGDRWRHPVRFERTRPDLDPAVVPVDLDIDSDGPAG